MNIEERLEEHPPEPRRPLTDAEEAEIIRALLEVMRNEDGQRVWPINETH